MTSIRFKQSYQFVLNKLVTSTALLLIVFLPLTSSISVSAECVAPETGPGVHQPIGPDSGLFTYNCDTNLWESEHYTYSPVTDQRSPKAPNLYKYNSGSGAYDYTTWTYNTPTDSYIAGTQSTSRPPASATIVGGPYANTANAISNTGAGSSNTINADGGDGSSIDNTGAGSNNNINGSGSNNTNGNNTNGLSVSNTLNNIAGSGNALVLSNNTAGSANSGDAQAITNVMNMLQSSSNSLGSDTLTFVANIDGDVNGDLLLDPAKISQLQPASNNGQAGNNNITFNNSTDAAINNDIKVAANTGDAAVKDNTNGGDATTGNAKAIANVVNVINSAITSGRSFMGVININGNLNGDILLPPDFVDQLIAANTPTVNIVANTGPGSANTINDNNSNNASVTNNNDLGITNNVKTNSKSGDAVVSGNTKAGTATTGNANASITAFNLTGSQVIGSNAILVFVNVTGQWVGLIVNAPQGSTAAGLGNGLISNNGNNSADITNSTKQRINNNLDVSAKSGNATVANNTIGGNATSGSADASINLLNVENSSLSLSNWFGMLFINVFGTWHGSFGVNTSAGDPVINATGYGSQGGGSLQAFSFKPSTKQTSSSANNVSGSNYNLSPYAFSGNDSNSISNSGPGSNNVIGSSGENSNSPKSGSGTKGTVSWPLVIGSGSMFMVYLAADRFSGTIRRSLNLKQKSTVLTKLSSRN